MLAAQPTAWLWIADCACDGAGNARSLALLSESELSRYVRIRNQVRRRQFLHGRLLLREMLARRFEQGVAEWPIIERSGQAPRLARETPSPTCFSISHSHQRVACLVADGTRAGCDIEFTGKTRDIRQIVSACFDAKVASALDALPPDRQQNYFYRLWTKHEAAFKAGGVGIHLATAVDKDYCLAIALDRPQTVMVRHTDLHTGSALQPRELCWQAAYSPAPTT